MAGPQRARPGKDQKELEELRERARALQERVKELACLHAIGRILEDRDSSLEQVLRATVAVVPPAMQHPHRACARLVLGPKEYTTPGYCVGLPHIRAPLRGQGSAAWLEVAYRGFAQTTSSVFLKEERRLLRLVAARITDILRIKSAEETVRSYERRLQSLAARLAGIQEQERRVLATFLHDKIGQALVFARLKVRALRVVHSEEAELEQLDSVLEEALQNARSLTFEISPTVLYELGFVAALGWLADRLGQPYGLVIELQVPKEPLVLREELAAVLFRGVRELLTNVIKHASAKRVWIRVKTRSEGLEVSVRDDGRGFATWGQGNEEGGVAGFGLLSLREQLRPFGGVLEITAPRNRGARALLRVPLATQQSKESGS